MNSLPYTFQTVSVTPLLNAAVPTIAVAFGEQRLIFYQIDFKNSSSFLGCWQGLSELLMVMVMVVERGRREISTTLSILYIVSDRYDERPLNNE